jgi:hypothetical protein
MYLIRILFSLALCLPGFVFGNNSVSDSSGETLAELAERNRQPEVITNFIPLSPAMPSMPAFAEFEPVDVLEVIAIVGNQKKGFVATIALNGEEMDVWEGKSAKQYIVSYIADDFVELACKTSSCPSDILSGAI